MMHATGPLSRPRAMRGAGVFAGTLCSRLSAPAPVAYQ